MLPISTAYTPCFFSRISLDCSNSSSSSSSSSAPSLVIFVKNPRRKGRPSGGLSLVPVKHSGAALLGFARRCKGAWDREGDSDLEVEILEFMRNSEKPEAFPSKKQLIDAGRRDLATAISEKGGWLAMGWDLDDDDDDGLYWNPDIGDWEYRMSKDAGNGAPRSVNSSNSASSTGRSLETAYGNDSGIEGILTRLEKERDVNFGLGSRGKGNCPDLLSNDDDLDDWLARTVTNDKVADIKRSNKGSDDSVHAFSHSRSASNIDGLRNSLEPAWRTWSMQRAASSNEDFEAGEIILDETRMGRTVDGSIGEFFGITDDSRESSNGQKKIDHNHIQSRLKSLELELSSVLGTLRSKADAFTLLEDHENSSEEFRKLSDAWEFQENEIMNAQDKLRSLRAKLAVLEGKMALALIDAQKIVDEKQRRIDDARKALRLLCTALIVWTSPASEVLLAGSYDCWTTKRKMKSKAGIFSVQLELYPGRYEIKFIVDGEWKVDPLRPIVNKSGHENNLLIIT